MDNRAASVDLPEAEGPTNAIARPFDDDGVAVKRQEPALMPQAGSGSAKSARRASIGSWNARPRRKRRRQRSVENRLIGYFVALAPDRHEEDRLQPQFRIAQRVHA